MMLRGVDRYKSNKYADYTQFPPGPARAKPAFFTGFHLFLGAGSALQEPMLCRFLGICAVAVYCAAGATVPLTIKEISLMLRSGYSSRAVMAELAARRLADNLDPASEKQLTAAGASQALIAALKSGNYQLSSSEIAALRKPVATPAVAESPAANSTAGQRSLTASPTEMHDPIYQRLKDDLVYWHNGSLVHFDDEALQAKKLYLLFFSAFWSKEGRQFTPRLIDYYNRVGLTHPEFEVIFFSADRSQFGMESYFSQTNMPWPALAYDKRNGRAGAIQNDLVKQIPCLVLADASGRVLANTSDNDSNPDKVLAQLDKILDDRSQNDPQ
jgi:hypothetical protein